LANLRSDPRNLEVIVVGNRSLPPDWFHLVGGNAAAGFIVPNTRSLSSTITLAPSSGGASVGDVQMIPTASGDPLLEGIQAPGDDGQIVLSAATARKLGVSVGGMVRGAIQRRVNDQDQASVRPLQVVAIAPEDRASGDFAFVTLSLLVMTEDYRDGTGSGIDVAPIDPLVLGARTYASARLYARDLDRVEALSEAVEHTGASVRMRSQQISVVRVLNRSLDRVAGLIVALGMAGLGISIAVSQWLGVERRRREISVLRLVGLTRSRALLMLVVEALIISSCAILGAGIVYLAISPVADRLFAAVEALDGPICSLAAWQFVLLAAVTVVSGGIGSLVGGARVLSVEPGECVREV
jgi:putative ABC transport system permease protein